MMIDGVFGRTSQILEKSMSLRMVRQGLIASNIANAETPNYRALDVDFKTTMSKLIEKAERSEMELARTDDRHFTVEGQPEAPEASRERVVFAAADSPSIGNDSNSASLEVEMARLQSNTTLYAATAKLLMQKLNGIKGIIDSVSRF